MITLLCMTNPLSGNKSHDIIADHMIHLPHITSSAATTAVDDLKPSSIIIYTIDIINNIINNIIDNDIIYNDINNNEIINNDITAYLVNTRY